VRFTADRKALAHALTGAARIAGDGRTIFALSHILLRAEGDALEVQSTNAELSLRLSVPASVYTPGQVIVPKGIAAVIKAMAGETVRVEAHGSDLGQVTFSGGAMTTTVAALASSAFPVIPESVSGPMPFDGLAMAAAYRALPMASRDASRPVLTGVYVERKAGDVAVIATDSYRMTMWTAPDVNGCADEHVEAIVPARLFAEAGRLLPKGERGCLLVDRSQATIYVDRGTITARLIDGQFPEYRDLVPEPDAWAEVDRAELLAVLNRVGLVAGAGGPVRLEFAPDRGELDVGATGQLGTGGESLDCRYNGEPMTFGFNPAFLIDGLRALEGDTVRIGLLTPLRPVLLAGDDPATSVLVMPMRVAD